MKNKKYLYPLVIGLLVIGIFTCAAGLIIQATTDGFGDNSITVTDNISVSNFNKISLKGAGEITISQGETESLTVETSEKKLKSINAKVENGTLILSENANNMLNIGFHTSWFPIKYIIVVKDLKELNSEGAGNILINKLETKTLVITQKGVGNIVINDLTADSLETVMEGTGNIVIHGNVTNQTLDSKGVGSYQTEHLQSTNATIKMKGVGSAKIWATGSLDAELEGVGSLEYYGSPKVHQSQKGLGTIERVGESPK